MRRQLIAVVAALALVCASTALAGGWATVKLSSSPKGLAAGEPWVVDITVLQHGLASQPLLLPEPDGHDPEGCGFPLGELELRGVEDLPGEVDRPHRRLPRPRRVPRAGTWRYEVFDGFTQYGGARTHKFAPVKVAPSGARRVADRERKSAQAGVA